MPEDAEENEEFLKLVHNVLLEVNNRKKERVRKEETKTHIFILDPRPTRTNGLP